MNATEILFLTDNFLPHAGGSRIIYYNIIRRLSRCRVTLVTREAPGGREWDAGKPFEVSRIGLPELPALKPLRLSEALIYANLFRRAAALLLGRPFDVIHCGEVLPTGLVGAALGRLLAIPYIVYVHGEELNTTRRLRIQSHLARWVLSGASRVVATCSYARELAIREGAREERSELLLPGIDSAFLAESQDRASIREALDLAGRSVIVTVGRLVPRKGQDLVIRALPAILERVPDAAYLVVGDGEERARLESLASDLGVRERVVFAGGCRNEDVPYFLAAADLFAMPNRELPDGNLEGFGIVFIEAGARGLPVIGGASGGTGDSIVQGRTGFLVDPENPSAFADAAIRLLCDPTLRARMGEAARKRALGEFHWDDRAARVEELTESLAW